MKKFTDEEEHEYAKCQSESLTEVTALHQSEIDNLQTLINDCVAKTEILKSELKEARKNLKKAKKATIDTSNIEKTISDIQLEQKDNKTTQKAKEKELKELMNQIIEETKPVVKKKFDYDIPIAKIDDAGITTTGAASSGNQLPQLVQEYRDYQLNNSLWNVVIPTYEYRKNSTDKYCRIANNKEIKLP